MIEVGKVIPFELTVRDSGGTPVDAAGGAALTLNLPDGTIKASPVDFTIQHVALSGVYRYPYPTALGGLGYYRWVVTDPVNGGVFGPEPFYVEDPTYIPFVSLDEQVTFMNARGVIIDPGKLDTLRGFVRIACSAVETDLGRKICQQTIVRTVDGGQAAVVLPGPVLSVTSVVEGGITLAAGQYVPDISSGILYRGSTYAPTCFRSGMQNVVITYRVGAIHPHQIERKVAMNGALRMWQGSQQMPHPTLDDLDVEMQVQQGLLTPLEMAAYTKRRMMAIA
jgi:hypothetical protein